MNIFLFSIFSEKISFEIKDAGPIRVEPPRVETGDSQYSKWRAKWHYARYVTLAFQKYKCILLTDYESFNRLLNQLINHFN